jgi:plastocyanin
MAHVTTRRLLLTAAALLLPACGGAAAAASNGGGAASSGGPPAAITISAHNFGFTPSSLAVAPGSIVTVTFINNGSVKHNLTASTVNVNVDGDPGSTQTATFTAPASGTIAFHCEYHPTLMTGTITVGSAAAPASSAATTGAPSYGY